jgi:putative ABC transport system ATP-binding protein
MSNDLYLLKNVSKRYTKGKDSISIFENLSLNIPEGDFVAIMGPSGSGKTTLLNLLGGIDQVSEGSLLFRDQQLDKYSEGQLSKWRARNVGFIFQFYNLMPMLNAAQNVELPLLLTTLSGKERARNVETALQVVGLSDRARHSPKEMSGGQQQRVAIARAIVADPAVLICDEPTGDLDRTTANEILEMLQLLNQQLNKTIIMVTHDAAAAKYAQRTLHLDKGKFVEETMTHA